MEGKKKRKVKLIIICQMVINTYYITFYKAKDKKRRGRGFGKNSI